MSQTQNKRTIIREAIESGDFTRAELMEKASVNAAGFASQLSYMRMGGIFPVADPTTGIYKIVDEATWTSMQNDRKTGKTGKSAEELTPEAMRAKLEGKAKRAASAHTNADKKSKDLPGDKLLKLKAKRAAMDLEICEIELGQHQAAFPDLEEAMDANEVPTTDGVGASIGASSGDDLM